MVGGSVVGDDELSTSRAAATSAAVFARLPISGMHLLNQCVHSSCAQPKATGARLCLWRLLPLPPLLLRGRLLLWHNPPGEPVKGVIGGHQTHRCPYRCGA